MPLATRHLCGGAVLPDDLEGTRGCGTATGDEAGQRRALVRAPPVRGRGGRGLVDILQPDLAWCGGISAGVRICHLAEAQRAERLCARRMNYPWGQHLALAMPAIQLGERSEGVSPPGVPLEEMTALPATAVIRQGPARTSDPPGLVHAAHKAPQVPPRPRRQLRARARAHVQALGEGCTYRSFYRNSGELRRTRHGLRQLHNRLSGTPRQTTTQVILPGRQGVGGSNPPCSPRVDAPQGVSANVLGDRLAHAVADLDGARVAHATPDSCVVPSDRASAML
jgi:Enolase C-terminal domain-like